MACTRKKQCLYGDICPTARNDEYNLIDASCYKPLEQTNDEWRKTCSTEEFAEFLFHIAYMCSYCGDEAHSSQEKMQQCHFKKCGCQRKDWNVWLKQPHREAK